MSFEELKALTPSGVKSLASAKLDEWVGAIEKSGYVRIPVYHNVKEIDGQVKSVRAREILLTKYLKVFYVHATLKDKTRYLVASNKADVFKSLKWDYETAVRGSE